MVGAIVGDIAGSRFDSEVQKEKSMRKLMVIVGLASWVAVAAAVETEPCERWDDIGTNLALPEEIAGMYMQKRTEYGKDDQSFSYVSREFVARADGQRVLTLYLYKRDWANLAARRYEEARVLNGQK